MAKTAIVIGASGLVGQSCVEQLLSEPNYDKVKAVVRKPLSMTHPKLEQIIVDFDQLGNYSSLIAGDEVFCCLGTTIKIAGTKENFYKVDFTYVLETAKIALSNGAKGFFMVSAMGADSKSMIFYSRVKGEIEEAVKKLNYRYIYIFRPSLLLGDRKEQRAGEKVGEWLNNILGPIMVGPLKKYKGIESKQVANAMIQKSISPKNGIFVLLSDEIQSV